VIKLKERYEVTRRHITIGAVAIALVILGTMSFALLQLAKAHAQLAALQALASKQREQLRNIDSKTAVIRSQLQHVQRQNQEIQQLIGVQRPLQKTSYVRRGIDALVVASARTTEESNILKRLTLHVLNVRHLQALARARALAAIPSIDPVDGAEVVGCYCYRTYPDAEFHPGVDLGANYGDTVHAAAAGTIASAGWDGGYGLKIDIDHGNGYHTWYAHLSKIAVHEGEYVHKGEMIGLVGSTGFSTGPHLHYQIMLNGATVDPNPYLTGVPAKVLAALP
jgi:murein DD-endopeptidase MepM/ murein hydrolase activator NlpD